MGNVIKLNLINESSDHRRATIVIFQKNVAVQFDEVVIAWKVIEQLRPGWNHPFTYSHELFVAAGDSYGNFSPKLAASPGTQFHMSTSPTGEALGVSGPSSSSSEVQVRNALDTGAINAAVFRDGKLLASKTSIAPQQMAVFSFKPVLFLGLASQVQEGQVLDDSAVASSTAEISLMGVTSADIVMTGGGAGASSTPFRFALRNIQWM